MREIKFRRWDKGLKTEDVSYFTLPCNFEAHNSIFIFTVDTILNQYTGLKDKNGIEIYEVDLIKIRTGEVQYVEVLGNIYQNSQLLEN